MGRVQVSSDVFRALADPTRRLIVDMLASGARSATELRSPFAISQPALSQHLGILREVGLVSSRRVGRGRRYVLDPVALRPLLEWAHLHDPGASEPPGHYAPRPEAGVNGSPARPAAGLPAAADLFVGREAELVELAGLLDSGRLVTLVGPSGFGKTRLASELASRSAGGFADGARWVDLTPADGPEAVARAVAGALSLREQVGRSLPETIESRLRDSRMLLVLDNCEHVLDACAVLVRRLLDGCPGVSILATSNAPVGLAEERAWPVPALSVPDPAAGLEAIAAAESVRLFCDRADAVRRGFTLTPATAPAVAEICRRLDGVALAVELAAARVAVITPAEIAGRLSHRFNLLTGGEGRPERHQTLRAALDWTHDLLSAPERELLRRLSVFAGGFTLAAAEALCPPGSGAGDDILDPLAALVLKALVGANTAGQAARYSLRETIRLYAAERLAAAGETDAVRARHARWCIALAEQAEPALTGPDQPAWIERLAIEHDNLRAALAWLTSQGEAEPALRLAAALTPFWRVRGFFQEGRGRLEAALALPGPVDEAVRANALRGLGFLSLMMDEPVAAIAVLEQTLVMDRERGDARSTARSLLLRGNASAMTDRLTERPALEESISLARQAGDAWCLGHALGMLGIHHLNRGAAEEARSLAEECVEVARGASEPQSLRLGLYILGVISARSGDYALSEELLTEGLEVTRVLGEPFDTAVALQALGQVAARRGDLPRARGLCEEALIFARQTAKPATIAAALGELANVSLEEGERGEARRLFEESRAMMAGSGRPSLPALLGLGNVALGEGDAETARGLLEAALQLARSLASGDGEAAALAGLGRCARARGELGTALEQQQAAMHLRRELGNRPGWTESLEALGGLAGDDGVWEQAARLLGAAQSLRDRHGHARSFDQRVAYEADVAAVAGALGPEAFDAAWRQGTAMLDEEAAAYAQRRRGGRRRPRIGWDSLTRAERGVAALVVDGLTNGQIGERLFISRSTVEGHMASIFGKLGVHARIQLAREVLRHAGPGDRSEVEG